jgi:hypothetical protein
MRVDSDHFHAEGERDVDHSQPDAAGADYPERFVFQIESSQFFVMKDRLLVGFAHFGKTAGQSENKCKGVLRHGVCVIASSVCDGNPAARALGNVDVVETSRARGDESQVRVPVEKQSVNF